MLNGHIVCHTGVIQFPMRKGWKRVHRLVVLPDYQGIGIGTTFIDAIAEIYKKKGYVFNLTTTTPSMVHALSRSNKWVLKLFGQEKSAYRTLQQDKYKDVSHLRNSTSSRRVTYGFMYK